MPRGFSSSGLDTPKRTLRLSCQFLPLFIAKETLKIRIITDVWRIALRPSYRSMASIIPGNTVSALSGECYLPVSGLRRRAPAFNKTGQRGHCQRPALPSEERIILYPSKIISYYTFCMKCIKNHKKKLQANSYKRRVF